MISLSNYHIFQYLGTVQLLGDKRKTVTFMKN